MKNGIIKRYIASILVVFTIATSTLTAGFSANAASGSAVPERIASAMITTGIGSIPVIGSIAAKAFEPLLTQALGINPNVKILAKLDEVSKKLDDLSLQMDENTQTLLQQMYSNRLDSFNEKMTSLRTMTSQKYKNLAAIEAGSYVPYKKEIMTAQMLRFNGDNLDDFVITATTLADYVEGTQLTQAKNDGIYSYVFRANCSNSLLGGEAAIKSSGYVNEVNEVISQAHKLMMMVLTEKIYVYQNMDKIIAASKDDPKLAEFLSSCDLSAYKEEVNSIYWNSLLGDETNGYIGDYNRIFSTENENSIVEKYNKMINDNWFSYIRSTSYSASSAVINFVPLNREMGYTTVEKCGFDRGIGRYSEDMMSQTTANINNKVHSVLTEKELNNLYKHILSEPVFRNGSSEVLTLMDALENFGFGFKAWEESEEGLLIKGMNEALSKVIINIPGMSINSNQVFTTMFVCNASSEWKDIDNSVERYWDAKARYTAFNGMDSIDTVQKKTVTYYNYHEAQGCYSKETGDMAKLALMYFTAA